MRITITGSLAYGPSWATLESLVVGMLDTPGNFTRIARRDKGVNYRAFGTYDVVFTPHFSDPVNIELRVNSPAEE